MKEPPAKTRLLGHPAVYAGMFALTGFLAYQTYLNPSIWLVLAGALFCMKRVMAAHDAVRDYQLWKLEWDSMDDLPQRSSAGPGRAKLLVWLVVPGGFLAVEGGYLQGPLPHFDGAPIFGLGALAIGLAVLWRLVRSRHASPRAAPKDSPKRATVTACVAGPLVPVPGLQQAYGALPTHCLQVLHGR